MRQALRRQLLWIAILPLLLAAGYTAGYLLAQPTPAAVSRSLPQAPVDAPQPQAPVVELVDEA